MHASRQVLCLLLQSSLLLSVSGPLLAQPDEDSKRTNPQELVVKEKKGIRFKLPADWPIEEKDGTVRPVPVEEYLSQKFTAADSRLRVLEREVADLMARLRAAEEELSKRKETPAP